jgi:aspartate/glutamate racemase
MGRLGVVGGMGPESTIAYYRAIVAAARDLRPTSPPASVLINSIDVQKVLSESSLP